MCRLEGVESSIAVECDGGSGLLQGALGRKSLSRRRGLERDKHSCYERSHAGRSQDEAALVIEALTHIPAVSQSFEAFKQTFTEP